MGLFVVHSMSKETSYSSIFKLSFPIMLGTAAQNIIALTDSVFLYFKSENDFAAIGFVGIFYLVIAAIGYGFSRGGQILIARRHGEDNNGAVRHGFYTMIFFIFILAMLMFAFMMFATPWFFSWLLDSPVIYDKSLEYLSTRSYGVFFAYIGVAIIAFYTGVSRTKFIMIDTGSMAILNVILDYGLIFGKLGMPAMGIAGAGLASTISEVYAVILFIVYMMFDKKIRHFMLGKIPKIEFSRIKRLFKISSPIVLQSVVGMGSWFVFFVLVEKMGERPLAITNLGRLVYLVLSIPVFGYGTGINTLVSKFIGKQKRMAVMPLVKRTSYMSLISLLVFSVPIILFPRYTVFPLMQADDMTFIAEAEPVFYAIFILMVVFSVSSIFFNGLLGTGATLFGLRIQFFITVFYLVVSYVAIIHLKVPLAVAWGLELLYWIPLGVISWWYLRSESWQDLKV